MARSSTSKALGGLLLALALVVSVAAQTVGRLGRGIPQAPAPAPVVGGGVYSVAYTVNTTGWLTVPIAAAQGEIPSGTGLSIGGLTTQVDVKNKWSDNSAKFALITAKLASTGSKTITSAATAGGAFTPVAPTFSVQFVITAGSGSGSTYTAALGAYSATDKWLDGANVVEWRKQVTPTKAGPVAHDNLSVIFDVRSYSDGDHRINVQVLNARDNANMDNTTYSCTFINSGVTVYTAPVGLKQYAFTAWQQIVYLGSGQEAGVTLDFTKFYSTHQIPKPLPTIATADYTADLADPVKYGPLKLGGYYPGELNAPGLNPWLGPMDLWSMQFLVNQTASQRAVILHNGFNGLSAFTQSRIARNDDAPYRLDATVDEGGGLYMIPITGYAYPSVLRTPTVVNPLEGNSAYRGARNLDFAGSRLDDEHLPPIGLVAYLVTGDRMYLDAAKAFNTSCLFRTLPFAATGPDPATDGSLIRFDRYAVSDAYGISMSQTGAGTDARNDARTLRNVVYTAQMVPDADPERAYFLHLVNDNLAWLSYYNSKRVAPGTAWGDGALGWEGVNYAPLYIYDAATGTTIVSEGVFNQVWGNAEWAWDVYWANLQGIFTDTPGATTIAQRFVGIYVPMVTNPTLYPVQLGLGAYYLTVLSRPGTPGSLPYIFPATFAEFVNLNVNSPGLYVQAAATEGVISCVAATKVITSGTPIFNGQALVGDPVRIYGAYASNWADQKFRNFGAGEVRVGSAGIYYLTVITDTTHATLDRSPCAVDTTGGTLSVNNYPLVGPGNGPQSRLALYLAAYWNLPNSAAAKTVSDTYNGGEIDFHATHTQSMYGLMIPQ